MCAHCARAGIVCNGEIVEVPYNAGAILKKEVPVAFVDDIPAGKWPRPEAYCISQGALIHIGGNFAAYAHPAHDTVLNTGVIYTYGITFAVAITYGNARLIKN